MDGGRDEVASRAVEPPAFVVVWDLDDTLGSFNSLTDTRRWSQRATVHIRPGIREALERLSAEGFVHTVLTLASPAYAELALRGTGLRRHFAEVAGVGQRKKGDVEGIASAFGIPPEEWPHRILFIGDHPMYDPPRSPEVVFHLEVHALDRPAGDLAELILTLRDHGGGSLRRGFDVLAGRGEVQAAEQGVELRRLERDEQDPLLFLTRGHACPVVLFHDEHTRSGAGEPVSFVPEEILGPLSTGGRPLP